MPNAIEEEYAQLQSRKKSPKPRSASPVADAPVVRERSQWTAPSSILNDLPINPLDSADATAGQGRRAGVIADRESDYHARRRNRALSPSRQDAFQAGKKSQEGEQQQLKEEPRSYADVMRETQLERERYEVLKEIQKKELERELEERNEVKESSREVYQDAARDLKEKEHVHNESKNMEVKEGRKKSQWDERDDAPPKRVSRWDQTPTAAPSLDEPQPKRSRWDQTPLPPAAASDRRPSSRWDETPLVHPQSQSSAAATPAAATAMSSMTNPMMYTPLIGHVAVTPDMYSMLKFDHQDVRNRPWTEEELDSILPSETEGYLLLPPPITYRPITTPARKLTATPQVHEGLGQQQQMAMEGFHLQQPETLQQQQQNLNDDVLPTFQQQSEDLPHFKPEDISYFGKLLDKRSEDDMSLEELKERKIMRLLLRIKNGTPLMRKQSLKQIAERAREFGAGPLFNHILPLLMSPSLEEQERHLLVKVIDRVLYTLDDLVRPYCHKILVVIEPMLIDEDFYARVEGREIISNLSKAAGLATMIATLRPDLDHVDEYVRNTTARAFSVVASALGIAALLPFIKAVCRSKKSWQARHTGIKIVQQMAVLMGCAILPHVGQLIEAIAGGLEDEQQKVRTMTALAVAALAEASAPYGIEAFDAVLKPLWRGVRKHRGKTLAAFLKAIGYIIPLMDSEYANHYTREVMVILIREFQTADEEMKKIVLKVVKQCTETEGVQSAYLQSEVLPAFFRCFWIRRMALDKRNSRQLIETTVALAHKAGVAVMVERLQSDLKDEAEPYRKMVVEALDQMIAQLGAADLDERMEALLMDGMLFAFQEQIQEDSVVLSGFATVVNALGLRTKPYLPQICSTILWRLNNKAAKVRQQASDLVARIALVMNTCGEEKLLSHLGGVLYEYLGEEYPDVLGSILNGLKAIVSVIGMSQMNPPIKDLLPRLTPILKNRHEKVQENVIDLIGRIADRGAEFVSAREWMRICFELLEALKAPKKAIRRATVNTFGYIAKAIGPQDVLATLMNNLKVQERQMRVCTTVAIAIVAETCSPFTVIPALMNEYRIPEMYVQNGVLKSFSFMFEYIGEMGKDYLYAVIPLIEDALIDRDRVHRQIACATVKHISLGCVGLNCEDGLVHLLNLVWPNVFETAPHTQTACIEAVEGLRVGLGAGAILQYLMQGLFHPARKVREIYWRLFNNTYIGSQEALVPYYPRFEDEDRNTFRCYELDLVI